MGTQWQCRPRLIKAVNIMTRTSHYQSFTTSGTGYIVWNGSAAPEALAQRLAAWAVM
jgi:hypothetical protein